MKRALLLLLLLCGAVVAHATVPLTAFTVTYTCTGTPGPFAFTFPVYDATGFTVTINGVLQSSTTYTTIPVNNSFNNGGSVTLTAPCTASNILIITRVTPVDQLINYYDNMPSLPTITGRSVDKLTMIAQELEGLIGSIGSGSVSITATSPLVITPSPLTTIGVISCPTCSTGGGLTGTANQIDVTGSVVSLDPAIIFPGSITMGVAAASFGAATSLKVPTFAGATAGTQGYISYDTTAKSTHFQTNNADSIAIAIATAPAGSKCLHTNGTTGLVTEAAADCGTGGGDTITSPHSTLNVGGSTSNTTLDLFGVAGQIMSGATPALTYTPGVGVDNSHAGTWTLANGGAAAHTILGSAATTSNTILGPAVVIPNGHLVECSTSGTVCTFTDGGLPTSGTVTGTFTTNVVPKGTGTHALGDSSITDNGSTVSTTEPFSAASLSSIPSGGVGGGWAGPEGTAPATIGGITIPSTGNSGCYFDSTAHAIKCSFNNGAYAVLGGGGGGTYPNYGTDSGSVNTYAVSPSGCSPSLTTGKVAVSFIAANASTSSTPTLDYCASGTPLTITTNGTNALLSGCINTSRIHTYIYDGTGWQEDACDVGRGSIPVTDISPTSGDAILVQDLPVGATITRIICGTAATTSAVVDFKPASESAWGTLGSSILSGTITAVPGGATGTITTPALSTHTPLMMVVGTVTGTVGELYCQLEYTRGF